MTGLTLEQRSSNLFSLESLHGEMEKGSVAKQTLE